MPEFVFHARTYQLPRNIALLDTNVLVSLADPNDGLHENTQVVFELDEYVWIASYPAIVEAWNLLASRHGRKREAYFMMRWLLTPGNAMLMIDDLEALESHSLNTVKYDIDLVDAALMRLASDITQACGYSPAVHVATYDVGDFLRCFGSTGFNFNVYDMRHLTSTAS